MIDTVYNKVRKMIEEHAPFDDDMFDDAWMPSGFRWDMCNISGWTLAHSAAAHGRLPTNFTQWGLADKVGKTVAHVAASISNLPNTFYQWELADNNGWTVAHEVARRSRLPADFKQWNLKTNAGLTVAHKAAQYRCLPSSFSEWSIKDGFGLSVAHIAARYGDIPQNADAGIWLLSDKSGWTVAHEFADHLRLPPIVYWNVTDESGVTVARTLFSHIDGGNDIKEVATEQMLANTEIIDESVLKSIKEVDLEWWYSIVTQITLTEHKPESSMLL
jgi:hypothetical protein